MRFSLAESPNDPYEIDSAIVFYKRNDGGIAVSHDVIEENGTFRLGPGQFVTQDTVLRLNTLLNQPTLQIVAENIVAVAYQSVAWYEPASMRAMNFDSQDATVNAFTGVLLPQPPLLFIASRRKLRLFALMEDRRPSSTSQLALAPYWNIPDQNRGSVCTGSMTMPEYVNPENTEIVTESFFDSYFTHQSGMKKPWNYPGTYSEFLAKTAKHKRFDPRWLVPANITLKEAVCGN